MATIVITWWQRNRGRVCKKLYIQSKIWQNGNDKLWCNSFLHGWQNNKNIRSFADRFDSNILQYLDIKHSNLDNGRWHKILTRNGRRVLMIKKRLYYQTYCCRMQWNPWTHFNVNNSTGLNTLATDDEISRKIDFQKIRMTRYLVWLYSSLFL